jgi:hypothetical protein
MTKRIPIPLNVRIKVWTEAAGRCQFHGCNKPLWYNELTLNQNNFSEMAHIIGASRNGPRGGVHSIELAKDHENIMLVCDRCHKEIDNPILVKKYSPDVLRAMKTEHTERVRLLLDLPSKKTRPLILSTQIGGQNTLFGNISIQNAILPDYPDRPSEDWFKIEINSFDRTKRTVWETAKLYIDQTIDRINRACTNGAISHLSVFGLAPQPLLMYLGRQLGDKITMQVFEPRRKDEQEKKWTWEEEDGNGIEFKSSKIKNGCGQNVILLLALSDYLNGDKYSGMISGSSHIYQLTIDNPVQGFLSKKSEKSAFIQSCRSLLNQIQLEIGKDCTIHVLPATPASLAIEFGRLIQPTKDPKVWIYENINGINPELIFKLN